MSKKTITKFSSFVISLSLYCAISTGCFSVSPNDGEVSANDRPKSAYGAPRITGKIKSKDINESSGLAASLCQSEVLWTHNDSGGGPFIFAIDPKGENLGTWTVSGAKITDWEDMAGFKNAQGECFIYIGDIGNNSRVRGEFTIYRVREPQVSDSNSDKKDPLATAQAESLRFSYPDFRHDAETLMVHPETGVIYVMTKRISGAAAVYRIEPNFDGGTQQAKRLADISVPAIPNGFLTGGAISPDGKRAVICDYFGAYELVLPAGAKDFDEIWSEKAAIVSLGEREQGEAVSYSADGNSIFATSEKKHSPIIEVKRK
jgi:hypothetical protein